MANWKISNYYKKSCYEIQTYVKDDKCVHNEVGWRFGTWSVTTTDDKIPEIYWEDYGDTPDHSRLHLGSFAGSNVEEVELNEEDDDFTNFVDLGFSNFNNLVFVGISYPFTYALPAPIPATIKDSASAGVLPFTVFLLAFN